ncbi:hypothetical protein CEXT_123031 [Caerostris extrusa]|uniref:Uncharacterized protein n=1 Tax=Caerostris extrusa TaxID=172846 RepID=A0AAV4PUT1_CAEEX|nr:hypothetical protein CEXT_123031 [Caerostris extrusa]
MNDIVSETKKRVKDKKMLPGKRGNDEGTEKLIKDKEKDTQKGSRKQKLVKGMNRETKTDQRHEESCQGTEKLVKDEKKRPLRRILMKEMKTDQGKAVQLSPSVLKGVEYRAREMWRESK